jgi:hypothetical protein
MPSRPRAGGVGKGRIGAGLITNPDNCAEPHFPDATLHGPLTSRAALVVLGPPGAGKGTHAQRLAERLNIPHISTGDLFRRNLRDETPLGVEARRLIDAGDLVPDEVAVDMVSDRLNQPDTESGPGRALT